MTERARYWTAQLAAWERSGLTQAEFCRRRGIKAVTFAWGKRQLLGPSRERHKQPGKRTKPYGTSPMRPGRSAASSESPTRREWAAESSHLPTPPGRLSRASKLLECKEQPAKSSSRTKRRAPSTKLRARSVRLNDRYRLSQSPHGERFVLKGALMLLVWNTPVTRPTRDIDLLGRISNDLESVRSLIAEICRTPIEDDGLVFDAEHVTTERIAEDADYEGVRTKFPARLGNTRIAMQIDIGFSDVITPGPVRIS